MFIKLYKQNFTVSEIIQGICRFEYNSYIHVKTFLMHDIAKKKKQPKTDIYGHFLSNVLFSMHACIDMKKL